MPRFIQAEEETVEKKPVEESPQSNGSVVLQEQPLPWLAINIPDLGRIDQTIRECLLPGKLDVDAGPINMDKKRLDEAGVRFCCELLVAASVCDVVRDHDRKVKQYPTRVYIRRVTAWEKMPHEARLTTFLGGKLILNPKIFSNAIVSAKIESLPSMRPKRLF